MLNSERVLITNPKGLAEVLVHKSYDFVKPRPLVESIGQLLGIGLLVAEGEEHKVRSKATSKALLNKTAGSKKKSDASI